MKAYTIVEYEVTDQAGRAQFAPLLAAAIKEAGGRMLGTIGGKVVAADGIPPKNVNIIEWSSLEQAAAYRASAATTELNKKRDKVVRIVRRYDVEAPGN